MVYQRNAWTLICDNGLSQDDAVVVCRMFGYNFGTHLPGSKFGSVQAQIGITNVRCHGRENDFMKCPYDVSTACPSHKYASVVCSNEPIREESELRRVLKPAQTCHEIYQAATLKPVLNWANVCSPNILRTLRRTMIRFLTELLVRRIWFGQSKLYFVVNWLVMRCKLRPELAAEAQQTA